MRRFVPAQTFWLGRFLLKPCNPGDHSTYQENVLAQLRKYIQMSLRDMLRSILLSVEFKVSSYTKWATDLKENKEKNKKPEKKGEKHLSWRK